LCHHLSLHHRNRPARAPWRAALCEPAVCRELRRLRARHDSVPGIRAARAGRNLASYADLFPAVAFQAPLGVRIAQMTDALLTIEKLEVVYHRAITPVQGITLPLDPPPIVPLLAPTRAPT